jgi:uncharacterized protein (DUF3820 family)
MISRSTSLAIATVYTHRFTSELWQQGTRMEKVHRDSIYDFLYENDYEAWFCNHAKKPFKIIELKVWFMKIHTGESFVSFTKDWSWEQREKLGQRYLIDLARDYLRWFHTAKGEKYNEDAMLLLRRLELDGYLYREGELLQPQQDVLNVEQEKGILQKLFVSAKLSRKEDAFEFLRLSEEHFIAARWSDCISNARKFFELTLQEGARSLSVAKGSPIDDVNLALPVRVRNFLEGEGLFEHKEREVIDKLYGLLSETGAHPYMAESDQARLLRQLSLTFAQFILLRLNSALTA